MEETILLVDDEEPILDVCSRYCSREGYSVLTARNGLEAIEVFKNKKPSLIVMDLMMPKMDGWQAAEEIRSMDEEIPIIMLTALGEERDKLYGLTIGADDYLTKPFSPRELVLRIKNILRRVNRTGPVSSGSRSFGPLKVDLIRREVTVNSQLAELTAKEFDLLWKLVSHPSQVFSRSQLLEQIWGYDFPGDGNTVNVHIRRLREKLEKDPSAPEYIKTVWGIGYKFEGTVQ